LAMFLNGLDTGGSEYAYIWNTDYQLNDWPNSDNTDASYGAAFLFVTYFLDRFGEQATQAVVANPQNGLGSIDQVLWDFRLTDPLTNKPIKADDVFVDWTIANFLKDGSVADGRYTYHNFESSPQAQDTEEVTKCPQGQKKKVVQQYGVDYIRISCEGQYTLNFQGETTVGVLPENALSGDYSFWSNKGDESDMTLTQEFDFTGVSGELTLNYWTWYDLEVDYDYLYLEISEDGKQWEIITTPDCTTEDPSGNSYGCGYNGVTDGWVEQKVDLTPWAGKKVQLRFEYITDAAVNGEGFLLDDVSIPAIGYATDFETDDGGWQAAGWVRIENKLPQTYRVALIRMGAETTVTPVELSAEQNFTLPLNIANGEEVVLVVSGTTRFTRMPAFYYLEIK
jgi:immune inhibitor A